MQSECEFYVGASRRFEVTSKQTKQVDLTLFKVRVREPASTQFHGRVCDGWTGRCLEGVRVLITHGNSQYCDDTDACGQFHFSLPFSASAVSITFWKPGYYRRCIGAFPIHDGCDYTFALCRIV